jgi:uncharacterized protein with FMN-binding domain
MTPPPLQFAVPLRVSTLALALMGTMAGCAGAEVSAASSSDPAGAATPSGETDRYRDGTYSATGGYESPNGSETISVELTIVDDLVSEVSIGTNPTNPSTARYQTQFAGGIAAEVVGRDIDSLDVTRVAGSSLTSGGFRAALETITADARLD